MRLKYGNKLTVINGTRFHSKGESRRFLELQLLEKAEKISNLKLQVTFPLIVNGVEVATYKADFTYIENSKLVIEDYKGFQTDIFKLKWKILKAMMIDSKDVIFRITT